MEQPAPGVTLMSDGTGIYEAALARGLVDLSCKSGQGVFAIALDAVWDDLEGT